MSQEDKKPNEQAPTIDDVRAFWDNNPLFSGEGDNPVGSREWFEEAERVIYEDCYASQNPEEIYTAGLDGDSRILDVGCGHGFWVRYFLKCGFENLSACDLSATSVELAKRSLVLFGFDQGIEIKVGNAEDLPFGDESFDHINCQGVVHHTPNTKKCLEEFSRVLKPGGTLCFSVYYKNMILRSPFLTKAVSTVLSPFVALKGRGREKLLNSGDPSEIVRMYDGAENPIGKAYTLNDIEKMTRGLFSILAFRRHFFPVRAFPIAVPKRLHRYLHDKFGLLIVVRARKEHLLQEEN
ncbi:MAG: class I SAM-dependent methyltransferase [Pseudomonadota bacterium]